MRVVFELTQEDLTQAQAQAIARQTERIRQSPVLFFVAAILASVLGWPLLRVIQDNVPFFSEVALPLPLYVVMVVVAVALVWALRRFLRPPQMKRLNAWAARRAGVEAAKRSSLGEVFVELKDDGVAMGNDEGEVTYPYAEVERILRSEALLMLPIEGQGRAVLVPQRAFSSEIEAAEFLQALETATGKKAEAVAV